LLEFVPPVLERLGWRQYLRWWHKGVPYFVIGMLTLFCFAMTESVPWATLTFSILFLVEMLFRSGLVPRGRQMPLLLIMAGVMLSTLHQSSLGTLFLAVDHLHPLWYTPILPVLFLTSAVMVAPAVVILESTVSAWAFRLKDEGRLLRTLARGMPYAIGLYLALRVGDILLRGEAFRAVTFSFSAGWWWLEMLLLLGALVLFLTPSPTPTRGSLQVPAVLTVGGLVAHRVGVSLVGISVEGAPRYVPALSEILITAGLLALGLLAFRFAVGFLPVYGLDQTQIWALTETSPSAAGGEQRQPVPQMVTS